MTWEMQPLGITGYAGITCTCLPHLSLVLPFIHQHHSAAVFFSLMDAQKLFTLASCSSIFLFCFVLNKGITISYFKLRAFTFLSRFSLTHFHLQPQLCHVCPQSTKALVPDFAGVFLNIFMLPYMNILYLITFFYSFFGTFSMLTLSSIQHPL